MASAKFLIFPSEYYETFALTVVEALSQGTPVIAADLPSVAEMVQDNRTGLRFIPGDAEDLAAKVRSICADPVLYQSMRRECRRVYEQRYTDEINYELLIDIYNRARVLSQVSGISPLQQQSLRVLQ